MIRWYIEYNGDKKLQYTDECGVWLDVEVYFERELEWRENSRLKERIIELEKNYALLQELKK